MRYLFDEETILVGKLTPNSNVTIKIIDLEEDKEITLLDNTCKESSIIPGIYLYYFKLESYSKPIVNCFYYMEDDKGKNFIGKFVYGGSFDEKLSTIYNIETGNWKIENNQFIIFDDNGNEIVRFNLYDKFNNPSETQVYKRLKAQK